jgi:hypothetical protein
MREEGWTNETSSVALYSFTARVASYILVIGYQIVLFVNSSRNCR